MTYNPSIPGQNDLISASQSQIQTNFSQANTAFGIDHTAFDVALNQGKHKQSTYVEISDPTTVANELAVYSKDSGGVTQLFLRRENNGTVIQMSIGDPIASTNGSSFLPGGVVIKWGQIDFSAASKAVTFASAFPTAVFSITLAADTSTPSGNGIVSYTSLSTSGFTAYQNGTGSLTAKYIAIGN
jgi:hypothetical protein